MTDWECFCVSYYRVSEFQVSVAHHPLGPIQLLQVSNSRQQKNLETQEVSKSVYTSKCAGQRSHFWQVFRVCSHHNRSCDIVVVAMATNIMMNSQIYVVCANTCKAGGGQKFLTSLLRCKCWQKLTADISSSGFGERQSKDHWTFRNFMIISIHKFMSPRL